MCRMKNSLTKRKETLFWVNEVSPETKNNVYLKYLMYKIQNVVIYYRLVPEET